MKEKAPEQKPGGRPPEKVLSDRIDASPEQIAEVVPGAQPKKDWRYLTEQQKPRK